MLNNIDKKDLAILRALDEDVRASYTQLGKKTRLSKEVVQYRIKRLQEKGILTGFISTPKLAGESNIHKVLLKNKSLNSEKKEEFLLWATSQKEVSWLATTQGSWDFIITSITSSHVEFALFLNKLFKKFGNHFKEKQILQTTQFILMNEKYLYDDNIPIHIEENDLLSNPIQRDEVSKKIIQILSENARASFTQIAKEVGLTSEAISHRFRNLDLLHGFGPRINHDILGLEYFHIFLSVQDFNKLNTITQFYKQHSKVVFIMRHVGYYDIHLELVLPKNTSEKFLDELTGKFGSTISSYELLKVSKEHFIQVIR